MKKRFFGLLAIAFIPTILQFIVKYLGSYGIGLVLRIIAHVFLPVIVVSIVTNTTFLSSFFLPLHFKEKKETIRHAIIGGILAIAIIISAYFVFKSMIDFSIVSSELVKIGVNKTTYPFVALAIVLINPFLEEYFWRGFVFRSFDSFRNSYWTGIFFAIHHMIIIFSWFLLWQFLLITVFLSIVGIYFNHIYKKTGSIYATWFIHMMADLIIVLIGFFVLFR